MANLTRFFLRLLLLAGLLVVALHAAASHGQAQLTTQPGPDGTPQFERAVERRPYPAAGADEVLTYGLLVHEAARALPIDASPEEVKRSPLRKLLLDLRLMMDFNAFLYEPDRFEPIRDRIDASYEAIGIYKDLFDQAKLTGLPVDPAELEARREAMNTSLVWLRDAAERRSMVEIIQRPSDGIVNLGRKDQPRLWRIAELSPTEHKSSLAMVALLCGNALANLVRDGLVVDDILDTEQEADFHDIRKALRSVLVLVDMFPTASEVVGEAREPLAKLVDAYGEVNDASIAYHDARTARRGDQDERRDDLVKAYKKARRLADELVENGQLAQYVTRLTPLQLFDVDPFH